MEKYYTRPEGKGDVKWAADGGDTLDQGGYWRERQGGERSDALHGHAHCTMFFTEKERGWATLRYEG